MKFKISIGFITVILIVGFVSCQVQGLNINYKKLNESDKGCFVPFNRSQLFQKVNNDLETLKIQQITSDTIKEILHRYPFVCYYSWVPYCSGSKCENLKFYSNLEERYKQWNLHFLIVSETYDIEDIKHRIVTSGFDKQLYVIEHNKEKYGENRNKVLNKFMKEINGTNQIYSYQFYYKSQLIYQGYECSENIIDSLIKCYIEK